MLALTISVQAQTNGQHERNAFSFKSTKVKNAEGQISHVKVGAYVGNQLIQEFSYELLEPISEENGGASWNGFRGGPELRRLS